MICPHCQQEHPDIAVYCPVTGRAIPTQPPVIASTPVAKRSQYLKLGIGLVLLLAAVIGAITLAKKKI